MENLTILQGEYGQYLTRWSRLRDLDERKMSQEEQERMREVHRRLLRIENEILSLAG